MPARSTVIFLVEQRKSRCSVRRTRSALRSGTICNESVKIGKLECMQGYIKTLSSFEVVLPMLALKLQLFL